MEIKAFNDEESKWRIIEKDWKIKFKYLTPDQKFKVESLRKQTLKLLSNEALEKFQSGNGKEVNVDDISIEVDTGSEFKHQCYVIKYSIEDWENLYSEEQEVDCKIVNDELSDDLWLALIQDEEMVKKIFNKSKEVVRWNEIDKKKLNSSPTS